MSDEFGWLDEPAPAIPARHPRTDIEIREADIKLTQYEEEHILALKKHNFDVQKGAREFASWYHQCPMSVPMEHWDNPAFCDAVEKARRKQLPKRGITPAQTLLDTRKVVDIAMEPQPILYKGEPTGYQEIDAGAALKGLELLGKHQKVWSDESKSQVVIGIELIDWSGPKEAEKGEVIDVEPGS